MTVFEEFKARGMIAQTTNEEEVEKLLNSEKVSFYIGFDPTADSLHVGHFMQMKIMAHMQRAGHRPIALFGGGTGMIGDPSGKSDMRKMLTPETIAHNISCFKQQMSKFIDTSDDKALFLNNADWLMDLKLIDFMRDIGMHFSVNKMLAAECYKKRLETGLTFLEFTYMLLQSYDFYHLYKTYGCKLEFGGDDQWSNIIGGVELTRKKTSADIYGMTFQLLTTSEGKKMGKTEKGAVWLNPEKTTPYEFFQYWRNIADADVNKCMKLLTFMPLEEIAEYAKLKDSAINTAKEKLAYELTKMIHGEEEAEKALSAAKSLFGDGSSNENMPTTALLESDFVDGSISLLNMLVMSKLAPSKGEARRLIEQGGVLVNDNKISDVYTSIPRENFTDGLVVKKGKKSYQRFIVK